MENLPYMNPMGFPKTQGTLLHCRPFHLDNHAEDVCILKVSGFVDDFFSADVHSKLFGFKPDVVEPPIFQTHAQTSNLDHETPRIRVKIQK